MLPARRRQSYLRENERNKNISAWGPTLAPSFLPCVDRLEATPWAHTRLDAPLLNWSAGLRRAHLVSVLPGFLLLQYRTECLPVGGCPGSVPPLPVRPWLKLNHDKKELLLLEQ